MVSLNAFAAWSPNSDANKPSRPGLLPSTLDPSGLLGSNFDLLVYSNLQVPSISSRRAGFRNPPFRSKTLTASAISFSSASEALAPLPETDARRDRSNCSAAEVSSMEDRVSFVETKGASSPEALGTKASRERLKREDRSTHRGACTLDRTAATPRTCVMTVAVVRVGTARHHD